jgi:5-methyltetrahydrofolate--homocysteine methyltransferase
VELMESVSSAVIEGKADEIQRLTQDALEAGKTAEEILNEGLVPGMDYVGAQMKRGEMFIPEVLLSARVMQAALTMLKPKFAEGGAQMRGRVVLGTVQGDLHDIGKNLVGIMLEGAGFEVHDLGRDITPEAFVQAVKEKEPDIVGMSALLTTTVGMMRRTIEALKEAGVRDSVKLMVGGAPLTSGFAEEIEADGYGPDAVSAVELAKHFMALK